MTEGIQQLHAITEQVENEAKQLASVPMFGSKIATPIRLLVVWMKGVNAQMTQMQNQLGGQK